MLRQSGLHQEAEAAGRRAVALDSRSAAAWSNLGIVLRESGKLEESLNCLLKVAALSPDSPEAHNNEVPYEAVVEDLEGEARRLIAFCGLEWNEACLSFHTLKRPVRTASVTQVRQPIYRGSVGRWRPYARYLGPLLEALERQAPA